MTMGPKTTTSTKEPETTLEGPFSTHRLGTSALTGPLPPLGMHGGKTAKDTVLFAHV